MNINSKNGDKVRVTRESIKNGYSGVRRHAMKHLEVGKEYTIDYTIVYESVTDVYLKEIPNEVFNSVSFEDQTCEWDICFDFFGGDKVNKKD